MEQLEDSFDGTFPDNIRSPAYKATHNPKKNRIVINVADTQYAVVKHVAKKNKWFMQTEPIHHLSFDICWTDQHVKSDLFLRMQPHQKINHFPGMAILSRKNNLGNALMNFRKRFPGEYDFFPITWNLPQDYPELQGYHDMRQQGKAQTFIVKPEASCQGRGIYLTRNIDKLKYDRCVVQRYMHKPYLIDGLKFDLRIYVLVAGIDPLRIFVYQEGLARFATEQYRSPRSQNLDNKFMHLTNYAINKESPNFVFNDSVGNMDTGHKRSLTSIYKRIEEDGHDIAALKQRINDILIKTIITGYPTLSHSVSLVHPDNFSNDMCFQVLGFDVMLDHKLTPYLIEINYTPSFTADTPLDRHIKKNLITDTFKVLNVSQKWKKEMKQNRDRQIQQRMLTGKRKKYTPEERIINSAEQARRRDEHEKKNSGRYNKIFLLGEEQLRQYRKYYDYATELYNSVPRPQNASLLLSKNSAKESPPYAHYYFVEGRTSSGVRRREEKQNAVSNQSRMMRQGKEDNRKNNQTQSSFLSQNKRVSSAKGRREKKERKVVLDRGGGSKKSIKQSEESGGPAGQLAEGELGVCMQNQSIFTNKGLQQLILKQRQSQQPPRGELSYQNDFNW